MQWLCQEINLVLSTLLVLDVQSHSAWAYHTNGDLHTKHTHTHTHTHTPGNKTENPHFFG